MQNRIHINYVMDNRLKNNASKRSEMHYLSNQRYPMAYNGRCSLVYHNLTLYLANTSPGPLKNSFIISIYDMDTSYNDEHTWKFYQIKNCIYLLLEF